MTFAGSGRTKITAGSRQPGMFTRQPSPRNVSSGVGITSIDLDPSVGVFPTGSPLNPATLEKIVASPFVGVGLHYVQALFDPSTNEAITWVVLMPEDISGSAAIQLLWGCKGTTGNVVWRVGVTYAQASSTDLDAANYGSPATSSGAVAVPGTAGQYKKTTISNLGSILADDLFFVYVERNAGDGSDTAASDATLIRAKLTWA